MKYTMFRVRSRRKCLIGVRDSSDYVLHVLSKYTAVETCADYARIHADESAQTKKHDQAAGAIKRALTINAALHL